MRAPDLLPRLLTASCLLVLAGCPADSTDTKIDELTVCDEAALQVDLPPGTAGAPQAGIAEGWLDLPIGTPLSGYTSRCTLLGGGEGNPDHRGSNYTTKFSPSAGVQQRIPIKVIWLSNGDQDLVLIKTDIIYSFDGLVEEMEKRLEAATGKDLDGKVVVSANHSHHAYGDFSDQVTYYLGSDKFNYEVFTRMAEAMESTALTANDSIQPVKIGVGFAKDWDPDDQVYHDRRDNNDTLQVFDDIPAGSYKDPTLSMIRIDTLADEPLAVLFDYGIHGTTLGGDNPMVTGDAPSHVETVFEESFDTPVMVAHFQGGAGDASPSGSDSFYASLETTGEHAVQALHDLWEATPTSAEPITLETASRSISEVPKDIHVTRNGAVDWYYLPYDEDYTPDNVVYGDNGEILSPLDEFNTEAGEAFCGEDPPYLAGYAPADVFPYNQCVSVVQMSNLIWNYFDLSEEEVALPLLESRTAAVTATRFGPVAIRDADGTTTTDSVLMGFFPGEPTSMYTEQFRRRAAAEAGYKHSIAVGYSQDHEGYLLIPEDWLMGGYESDINIWGPLQAEHIMERLLEMVEDHLNTPEIEKQDPCGVYASPDYGVWTLPSLPPDPSPDAGTLLTNATKPDYLFSPLYTEDEFDAGVTPDLDMATTVPRIQGLVEVAWIGGDPGADWPVVTLQTKNGDTWEPVYTTSGRVVSMGPDILVTTTPDPIYPASEIGTHYWYAAWQAIGHVQDRPGVPEGTYRLHIEGKSFTGSESTYPWTTTDYSLDSEEFQVVPGAVTVSADAASGTVYASLVGPARGYRLITMDGNIYGNNPLVDDSATLEITTADGTTSSTVVGTHSGGLTVFSGVDLTGAIDVRVTDVYGNTGSIPL